MISVCMIVKNEEEMLAECLQSVADADEIIVCDTGSEDSTIEVARQYTDLIYTDFTWCDDFAKARNHADSKASQPWILSMDADETLEPGGIEKLRALGPKADKAVDIWLYDYLGRHTHKMPKFYRNDPSIKWIYPIHTTINVGADLASDVSLTYRWSPAHKKDPDRTIRILKRCLEEEPDNARYLYYLAREYYYRKNYEQAEDLFLKCIRNSNWIAEKADAWVYIARCRWRSNKGTLARRACLTALGLNPHFREAALLMAEMSWEHNKSPWLAMARAADNRDVIFIRTPGEK